MRILFDMDDASDCKLQDIEAAERDAIQTLQNAQPESTLLRKECLERLGWISWLRFTAALKRDNQSEEHYRFYGRAFSFYESALSLTPEDDLGSLYSLHKALGKIYLAVANWSSRRNSSTKRSDAVRCWGTCRVQPKCAYCWRICINRLAVQRKRCKRPLLLVKI